MIWRIAQREIMTRGRSKGYRASTAFLFVAVIAAAFLSTFLISDDEAREVDIGLTPAAAQYSDALSQGNETLTPTIEMIEDRGIHTAVAGGTSDVVFDGQTLTWDGLPDGALGDYIRGVVQQQEFASRAAGLGLGPDDIGTLFSEVEITDVRLDGGETETTIRYVAAGVAGLATFFLLQTWGSFVTMGVIEEKSSKVVEILLSQVRASSLLGGKVIGLGLLAMGQMIIFVIGLTIALIMQDVDIPNGVWQTVPLFVATFVLGFAFYASAFAAVGSLVSRQEDAVSVQLPAMIPLFVGYFIAFSSLNSPGNMALTVASFVPFTSPIALPFRNALVPMPIWQILLSLVILAVSAVIMVQLAGQIYRYTLLRTGSRVGWKDAWVNRGKADI